MLFRYLVELTTTCVLFIFPVSFQLVKVAKTGQSKIHFINLVCNFLQSLQTQDFET